MKINKVFENLAGILAPIQKLPWIPAGRSRYPAKKKTVISTGLRGVDRALEIGGLPRGAITELICSPTAADEGVNSYLTARLAAGLQRQQQAVTIIDMSGRFDPWQAERAGLVAPQLLLSRPATVFRALNNIEKAANRDGVVIVMMGHVPGLLRQASPKLRRTLLFRLRSITHQSDSAFVVVTEAAGKNPFSPVNYPRGLPLGELAVVRVWLEMEGASPRAKSLTTCKVRLTVIKNRLASAGKGAVIRIKLRPGPLPPAAARPPGQA